MRIILVILGIVLIAGIWLAHRLRTQWENPEAEDESLDWDGDDAVHIRAGSDEAVGPVHRSGAEVPQVADPLERSWEYQRGEPEAGTESHPSSRLRREPYLGDALHAERSDAGSESPAESGEPGERQVQDIYGVLENDDAPAPPPHGAFEPPPTARAERRSGSGSAMRRARMTLGSAGQRLWGRLRGLRKPRARDTLGETLHPEHEVDTTLVEEPPVPDMEQLGEYVSAPRVVGRNPLHEARTSGQKILLLHVIAPRNRPFTGVALGAALQRAGMQPGIMDIYHLHEPEIDRRAPLFSATNMVAPGTLCERDLADMTTPGITLFTQIHESAHPQRAFEALLEHAHILARDLGGSILDAQQSTATNQTLAYMREDLNQWLMRHRPELLRGRTMR